MAITGGIYLETVIRGIDEAPVSDSHIREAHDWLVKYVRGGGPLPALRVAAIPYGVLPVQYINGERDATTKYRYIERVIGELRHTWRDSLEDVPRMVPLVSRTGGTYENDGAPTDADAEILTILSSQPNPAQYSTRRLPLEYVDTTLGVTSVFNLIVELMKLLQYPSDLDRVLERKLGEEWITTIEDQPPSKTRARRCRKTPTSWRTCSKAAFAWWETRTRCARSTSTSPGRMARSTGSTAFCCLTCGTT